jgi:methyltransferase
MSPRRYFLVLAGMGLQRLVELAYSARNERRLQRAEPAGTLRPPGFFAIVLINIGLFALSSLERLRFPHRRAKGALLLVNCTALAVAQGLRLSAIVALRDRWNVRATVSPRLEVCVRGPYRFIRHPNYAALLIEFPALACLGCAYATATILAVANGLVLARRIRDEEALLADVPGYQQLMGGKPRFVPLFFTVRREAQPIASD